MKSTDWLARPLTWTRTKDALNPYRTTADGKVLTVRVNDFPDEPTVYSLLVGGAEVASFDDWPAAWVRPAQASA